jgi:8-amino-3,8-dideoxy-alpha-D-manno-octulosonate transaminase
MSAEQTLDQSATTKLAINGAAPCVVDKPAGYGHGPQEIGEEEIAAVVATLRTKNLFRFNKPPEQSPTAQLEKMFAEKTGVKHALAVNSGTSALISGLIGLGISSGDEVIVPGYTYCATPASVLTVRAIPVIAEIDASLTIDPDDIEKKITPRTRAIIPVHMRGTPCRMDRIMAIAKKHNLKVLEDCAQANGASFQGRMVGSIGDAGAFSLQHYKIITAGEGGMLTMNDRSIYERAGMYHDSAYVFWMGKENWTSEWFLGENYRMSEMNGALGLEQLKKRDWILARLRSIKKRMIAALADLPGMELQDVPDPEGDCGTSFVMLAESPERAKAIAAALRAEGMAAGSIFDAGIPDRHIYYHWDYVMKQSTPDVYGYPWKDPNRPAQVKYTRDMCPRTLDYLGRTVSCPLTQVMTDRHVDSCIEAITKVMKYL